jgi:hypothetical protein
MKRAALILAWLAFVSAAYADLRLTAPPDRLYTFTETTMLQGSISPPGPLTINGQTFTVRADGSFSCGLVLQPGKNFVEVDSGREKAARRVLKEVTYPDIEQLYDGKRHWARTRIVYLSTLGYIEGYPDGNFYPGNPVTRGEFATWLARIKHFPVPRLDKDVFFDVPKEHWRAPYVKLAVDAGYMRSFPNNTFGLDDPISRREAANVAVQVEGAAIVEKIKTMFRDVPQTERGSTPIYAARDKGLIVGLSDKVAVYDPERALTRAEAAMLLSRFAAAQTGFSALFDFESGYTRERYCALNIPPEIVAFTVEPGQVGRREKTNLKLKAQIAPRAQFSPLARVRVDLSSLGGLPDAEMFDDATHGDATAGDLIYSLNTSLQPQESGEKILRVTATDKLGWEGKAESPLLIVE